MLSPVQQIVLTCLLGPEDKNSFKRFQSRKRVEKWALAHPEEAKEGPRKRTKKWRDTHPGAAAEVSKRCRLNNPEQARATYQKTKKKRYDSDPNFRLRTLLSGRLNKALNRGLAKKSARTMELLGCPLVWLEAHLESLFKPGMTWENHGSAWQIDHIRPCASFNLVDPEQQRICFHWTNLQPLFSRENLSKGDTYVV